MDILFLVFIPFLDLPSKETKEELNFPLLVVYIGVGNLKLRRLYIS